MLNKEQFPSLFAALFSLREATIYISKERKNYLYGFEHLATLDYDVIGEAIGLHEFDLLIQQINKLLVFTDEAKYVQTKTYTESELLSLLDEAFSLLRKTQIPDTILKSDEIKRLRCQIEYIETYYGTMASCVKRLNQEISKQLNTITKFLKFKSNLSNKGLCNMDVNELQQYVETLQQLDNKLTQVKHNHK